MLWLTLLFTFPLIPTPAQGGESGSSGGAPIQHRVAYDSSGPRGSQTHLMLGSDYKSNDSASSARIDSICGDPVEFGYSGLDPAASYVAKFHFRADAKRTLQIKAGGFTLAQSFTVEPGKTMERTCDIPAEAYQSGNLKLTVEKISGSNAFVSDVEILSGNPAPLGPMPPPEMILPRLSPRPVAVEDCKTTSIDLDGNWLFHAAPPAGFESGATESREWSKIQVPGEWAMQGFEVKPGTAAGYRRTFSVPEEWRGKRIKLRFDAVYSDAQVWVNGKQAGRHCGGFTPFEIDLTDIAKPGEENTLALSVLNESEADKLASATQYAAHQLGGILRHVRLFVLPETNLVSLRVSTVFDKSYSDATLGVELDLAQEGAKQTRGLTAHFSLSAPDGSPVPLSPDHLDLDSLKGAVAIPVARPEKWDNEHPNLYTLTIRIEAGGRHLESLTQKIGFRQIEIRGNEMLVNGLPVKLRGVNHHEVYPLTGRSVPDGLHRRDVEIFRTGNVNLLRTCHYPPDEALMEAADELGMFIECEAPFCWAPGNGHTELVCRQTAEMVLAYRNHPSVLFWSVANESKWGYHFMASSQLLRRLDPTRPQNFNDFGSKSDPQYTQILNAHYPKHKGPVEAAKGLPQPYYHGEDCHLNSYNRLELATDPGIRDIWGVSLRNLWDEIYQTKGSLGQSIWAGIDDTFYLKNDWTVGYGAWGPLDGWRREKPEFWNMKKAYSPLRVLNGNAIKIANRQIQLQVENRQNFSNLKENTITWKVGDLAGTVSSEIPPRGQGAITIALAHDPKPGDRLELTLSDPRGFVADQWSLPIQGYPSIPSVPDRKPGPAILSESATIFTVTSGAHVWQLDRKTGQLVAVDDQAVSGPQLMILAASGKGETKMAGKTKIWEPFTDPCSGWLCSSVSAKQDGGRVQIKVVGKYNEAEGDFTLTFDKGLVSIDYAFTVIQPNSPRQIGLVFTLPHECETLTWEREGYWDVYPEDHIARLKGTVKASEGFDATSVGPRTLPQHPWRLDKLPYGNNDFCSTKQHVLTSSVTNAAGRGFVINGHGKQDIRAWRTAKQTNFLVADFSNSGGAPFVMHDDIRELKAGDSIKGRVEIEALSIK